MGSGPHIALAVAIGYVLGRSRKMKLAIAAAGMMAGKRLTPNPRELLTKGGELLASSPEVKKLTGEARERLLDAAKSAAIAAATNKIESLGESLTERAAGLRTPHVEDVGERASGLGERASGLAGRSTEEEPEEAPEEERGEAEEERAEQRRPERSSSARRTGAKERRGSSERESVPQPRDADQEPAETPRRAAGRRKSSSSTANPRRTRPGPRSSSTRKS